MYDLTNYKVIREETNKRIKLAIYAYAYEFDATSLIDDHHYDRLANEINLEQITTRPDLDDWFKKNFDPDTGMWIHKHPELQRIQTLYEKFYKPK